MSKITLIRKANTVSATYLPYTAYKAALALATTLKGEIGKTAEGNFEATFATAKIAKQFETEWTANYNANRKVDLAPKATAPAKKSSTSKPTATKGKKSETVTVVFNGVEYKVNQADLVPTQAPKTSSTKKTEAKKPTAPRKSKGEAFDFAQFKGTKSEKNRALHAMLVSMGMKDSRTPEYMSVWNARPWAK